MPEPTRMTRVPEKLFPAVFRPVKGMDTAPSKSLAGTKVSSSR